jgi:hypothetical protein
MGNTGEKKKVSWKRHAGAAVLIILYALRIFGVDVPVEAEAAIGAIGASIFGAGWIDRAKTGPHVG